MKVRVLSNPYYGGRFKIGGIYEARPSPDGFSFQVLTDCGMWLCMLPRELRFICHGVAVPGHAR